MPKKKAPPLKPEEQRRRFEELARQVGARQTPEQFKKAVRRIAGQTNRSIKKK
jgi:hypothetical protein